MCIQVETFFVEDTACKCDPAQRSTCNSLNADTKQYKDKITRLLEKFKKRLHVFGELETEFATFRSPSTVKSSNAPVDIQLEIIDLQCDADLKDKFASVALDTFNQYLLPGYPKLTALAAKMLHVWDNLSLWTSFLSNESINKKINTYINEILCSMLSHILILAATCAQQKMPSFKSKNKIV